MRDPDFVPKFFRLPPALWAAISDYRFAGRYPTEQAAVIQLFERGLAAEREAQERDLEKSDMAPPPAINRRSKAAA